MLNHKIIIILALLILSYWISWLFYALLLLFVITLLVLSIAGARFSTENKKYGFFQNFVSVSNLLLFAPSGDSTPILYDLWESFDTSSGKYKFINWGYWKNVDNIDDAGANMAKKLGEIAKMNKEDVILDVGFGFGDQDLLWNDIFNPKEINGINITTFQVKAAQERIKKLNLEHKIKLNEGSATNLLFPKESFTLVTALECAFHFDTREEFFKQAFQVLKPGGRVAVTDILPLYNYEDLGIIDKVISEFYYRFVQIPYSNRYNAEKLKKILENIGYVDIEIEDITENVWPPLREFMKKKSKDPSYYKKQNMLMKNPLMYQFEIIITTAAWPITPIHYYTIVAKKKN